MPYIYLNVAFHQLWNSLQPASRHGPSNTLDRVGDNVRRIYDDFSDLSSDAWLLQQFYIEAIFI